MKFVGACNEAKTLMDQCFREEKNQKRKVNLQKSRAREEQDPAWYARRDKAWSEYTAERKREGEK
jgi:hypothetical protein